MSTVRISEEHQAKLKILAVQNGLKMGEFVELSIDFFEKYKENPKNPTNITSVKNTIISFFKTQEKGILNPIKGDVALLNKKMDLLNKQLDLLKNNIVTAERLQKILNT